MYLSAYIEYVSVLVNVCARARIARDWLIFVSLLHFELRKDFFNVFVVFKNRI